MILSEPQIKEILKKPKLKKLIEKGKLYESELRVFTEPKTKREIIEEKGWEEVIMYFNSIFSAERSKRVQDFINYPLSSVDVTESILTELYKVFEARNTFFDIETINGGSSEKLKETIQELNIVDWIKNKGKEVLKNQPNTIVVIDKDENGNPYLLPIGLDRLIDCSVNDDSTLNYIAFHHSTTKNDRGEEVRRVSFYDAQYYRVYIEKGGEYTREKNEEHKAGICPARMFLSDRYNSQDIFNRRIPLTTSISKIKEWQYFDIYKFYVDHYGPFPVIEKLADVCDDSSCENGTIRESYTVIKNGDEVQEYIELDCPTCSNKFQMGPGVLTELPPRDSKDDPDYAGVFKMITPDTSNLKYLQDKLDSIERYIKLKTVGVDNILQNEAINELQVEGNFESKQNALLKIKTNLDELYKWIVTAIYKIELGSDSKVNVYANFGTEFYLLSDTELLKRYELAKNAGLPSEELDMIYNQLIATKYKGNPNKIKRLDIIKLLDPLPHDDLDKAIQKANLNIITNSELNIKARLLSYVNRFETEVAPLVDFGKDLDFDVKIKRIKEILTKYSNENNQTEQVITITDPVKESA